MISPQTRISFAKELNISEKQANILLTEFALQQGFEFIVDFNLFTELVSELEWNLYQKSKNIKNSPLINSECPGWICYLEKVLGEKFIKFASKIKTPQLVC